MRQRLPNIYIPQKAFTMDETPDQSLSFIPYAAGVAQSRSHARFACPSLGIKTGVEKAGWCFTGILSETGNDGKRRKQSYLWYIYTIGCKSFLMGSRVQSRGRDYPGRSESAVTCICPGLALWTPPSCTLACRARPRPRVEPDEEVWTEVRVVIQDGWRDRCGERNARGRPDKSMSLCWKAINPLDQYIEENSEQCSSFSIIFP